MAGPLDKLLHPSDQARILDAIKAGERLTSGEIKVHVEARCPGGDAEKRAHSLFTSLGLTHTKQHNAVLVYLAVRDHRFALVADPAVRADANFFADASHALKVGFARGAFGDAAVGAVQALARKLAPRFPRPADDTNEIDNEITTDERAQ